MPTSIQMLNRSYRRAYWRLTLGISIFYVVALVGGLALLLSDTRVATWVSDAAQAEFAGASVPTADETALLTLPTVRHANAN